MCALGWVMLGLRQLNGWACLQLQQLWNSGRISGKWKHVLWRAVGGGRSYCYAELPCMCSRCQKKVYGRQFECKVKCPQRYQCLEVVRHIWDWERFQVTLLRLHWLLMRPRASYGTEPEKTWRSLKKWFQELLGTSGNAHIK